jgi:TPP-dependent 2-oxoacid decarboxylase
VVRPIALGAAATIGESTKSPVQDRAKIWKGRSSAWDRERFLVIHDRQSETCLKTACILPGILLVRADLRSEATAVVDASGLPFATMMMYKSALDETHPNYIGMYAGALADEDVRAFVEDSDCVLGIGALASDFNTGPSRRGSIGRRPSM